MADENLAGEGEADARAGVLGGEEGDEDAVADGGGYGSAVVGNEEGGGRVYLYPCRSSLHSILHQIHHHLKVCFDLDYY